MVNSNNPTVIELQHLRNTAWFAISNAWTAHCCRHYGSSSNAQATENITDRLLTFAYPTHWASACGGDGHLVHPHIWQVLPQPPRWCAITLVCPPKGNRSRAPSLFNMVLVSLALMG